MGKYLGLIAATLVGGFALSPLPSAAQETAPNGQLAPDGQPQGESSGAPQQLSVAENLQGVKVHDPQGHEIGSVDQLIVDPGAGKLAYVVISPEDSATGKEPLIVPWNALQVGATGEEPEAAAAEPSLVLDLPQEELQKAPRGDLESVLDRRQGEKIHQFYGVSPYWQEEQRMSEPPPSLPPGHPPVLPPGHPPVAPPGEEMPQAPQGQAL